jgi:hypothetical protein
LVEKTSSGEEEFTAPPQPEIEKETPPIQKPEERKEESRSSQLFEFEEKFPAAPTPKVDPEGRPGPVGRVKKEVPKPEFFEEMKKGRHEALTDEQDPSDIFPTDVRRETGRSEKIQIRIPNLTYQKMGLIIVIIIGGYLLWSTYSHLTTKSPTPNKPTSKEASSPLPPRPTPSTEPAAVPEPKVTHSPSIPSSPAPPKPPVSDGKEIENIRNLFENVREANLKKNIDLFMSCYSAGFKDREGKKRETLRNWGNFTYINLSYVVREHSISGDTAGVKIAWVILYSSKAGGPTQESKAVLDVTLNREPDGWKINNIKPIS